ncbi:MAG TPA: hypothetical protein VGQ76_03725 [Thermoanaerobaculia bacterium]|nr:hypothetical protein [Thermoanaerobaculia bacterium]
MALYREGRSLQKLPPPQRNCDRALELFEKSVTIEPRFLEAWSAGDIWTERTFYWRGLSRKMAIANARMKIDHALALDPAHAVAVNNRALLAM